MLTEVQGTMNGEQYCEIQDGVVVERFEKLEMPEGQRTFQQDMTPNIPPKGQSNGFKITTLMSWSGQLNPLTSTPLNTSGWT